MPSKGPLVSFLFFWADLLLIPSFRSYSGAQWLYVPAEIRC
jgi:hypothetical protein